MLERKSETTWVPLDESWLPERSCREDSEYFLSCRTPGPRSRDHSAAGPAPSWHYKHISSAVRMSIFGQWTFPTMHPIYGSQVTTLWVKCSPMGQTIMQTQPSIPFVRTFLASWQHLLCESIYWFLTITDFCAYISTIHMCSCIQNKKTVMTTIFAATAPVKTKAKKTSNEPTLFYPKRTHILINE